MSLNIASEHIKHVMEKDGRYIGYTYKQVDHDLKEVVVKENILVKWHWFKENEYKETTKSFAFESSYDYSRQAHIFSHIERGTFANREIYDIYHITGKFSVALDREKKICYWKLTDINREVVGEWLGSWYTTY